MPSTRTLASAAAITPGDHVCAVIQSPSDQRQAVTDFVQDGLEAGERVWYLTDTPGAERLIEYERLVDEVFATSPASALCQYDVHRFDPAGVQAALDAHPVHLKDGAVQTIAISRLPGGAGLRLAGEVDLSSRPMLRQALTGYAEDSPPLHLDLSELVYIDVAGTTELVDFARGYGGVVIHRPPYSLRRILEVCFSGIPPDILDVQP